MSTLTPNYNWILPSPNDPTDQDLWGGYLNSNISSQDTIIKGISDVAQPLTNPQTANYSVQASDKNKTILVDATAGNVTVTLLTAAVAGDGYKVTVQKTDATANTVTVAGTINGQVNYVLTGQYNGVTVISNGTSLYTQGLSSPASAADTLAGLSEGAILTPAGFAGNKLLAGNGYYKLPGGFIIQWGTYSGLDVGAGISISFPIAFTTAVYGLQAMSERAGDTTSVVSSTKYYSNATVNGFTLKTGGDPPPESGYWMAIGK